MGFDHFWNIRCTASSMLPKHCSDCTHSIRYQTVKLSALSGYSILCYVSCRFGFTFGTFRDEFPSGSERRQYLLWFRSFGYLCFKSKLWFQALGHTFNAANRIEINIDWMHFQSIKCFQSPNIWHMTSIIEWFRHTHNLVCGKNSPENDWLATYNCIMCNKQMIT